MYEIHRYGHTAQIRDVHMNMSLKVQPSVCYGAAFKSRLSALNGDQLKMNPSHPRIEMRFATRGEYRVLVRVEVTVSLGSQAVCGLCVRVHYK